MDEFSSYIYKENKVKTENARVSKERAYYLGILIFLIGAVFFLLEMGRIVGWLMMIGFLVFYIAQVYISFSTEKSIGHKPHVFKILKDGIFIGQERLTLDVRHDITVTIRSYKGQWRSKYEPRHSGTDNKMEIRFQGKNSEFNFILESEHAKDKLIAFCEEHRIRYVK